MAGWFSKFGLFHIFRGTSKITCWFEGTTSSGYILLEVSGASKWDFLIFGQSESESIPIEVAFSSRRWMLKIVHFYRN